MRRTTYVTRHATLSPAQENTEYEEIADVSNVNERPRSASVDSYLEPISRDPVDLEYDYADTVNPSTLVAKIEQKLTNN